MTCGGGKASLNGQTSPKRVRFFAAITNHTCPPTLGSTIFVLGNPARLRPSWRENTASRAFAIFITGFMGSAFLSDPLTKYLRQEDLISHFAFAGQTKAGAAVGLERSATCSWSRRTATKMTSRMLTGSGVLSRIIGTFGSAVALCYSFIDQRIY